jgi:hypothetical protein
MCHFNPKASSQRAWASSFCNFVPPFGNRDHLLSTCSDDRFSRFRDVQVYGRQHRLAAAHTLGPFELV